ncbi:hypothetical protein C9374_013331 [Naegleria lovaniensis]|uniref:Uncharacterized protein n=1 Tax=Naegleria lovaniensis TaxID=51637 RepID=A0AA88H0D7_NAELO|nr:uncharacterized protein C9374_013331 [Naegleria lovaniensis]KAG2391846.1 hypothetical protein C9374_013331 [Naegleria lovaniensis]
MPKQQRKGEKKSSTEQKKNGITFKLFQGGVDGKTTVWVPTNLQHQSEKAKETYEQLKQALGDVIEEDVDEEEEPKVMFGLQKLMDMQNGEFDDEFDFEEEIVSEETEEKRNERLRRTVGGLFPDDGYDYSKHIRKIGGGTFISAFGNETYQPPSILYEESPAQNEEEDDDEEDYEDLEEEEEEIVKPTLETLINGIKETQQETASSSTELPNIDASKIPFKLKPDFKAYGLEKYAHGKIDTEIESILENDGETESEEEEDENNDETEKVNPMDKYGEDYDDFFGEIVQELIIQEAEEEEGDDDDYIDEEEDETRPRVFNFDNDEPLPKELLKKFLPKEELILIEEEEAKRNVNKKSTTTKASVTTKKDAKKDEKPSTQPNKKVSFTVVEGDDDDDGEWEDEDGEWEDEEDEEGEWEDAENEEEDPIFTKSENRKQFDQDFDIFYKTAYADDQIGELDDNDPKLRENTEFDAKRVNDLLEDFFTEQRRRFGAGEFKTSSTITDEELKEIEAQLPPDVKVFRREDFEKMRELTPEERYKMVVRQMERIEKEESKCETEVITIPERDNRWDCETILTSYTNIYNHPSVIDDAPRKKKQIKLSQKSGLPIGVIGKQKVDMTEEKVEEDEFEEVVNLGQARNKNETKEERKERKKKAKELKRQKREQKKNLKNSFKEEELKQQKLAINPSNQQKVVVKY